MTIDLFFLPNSMGVSSKLINVGWNKKGKS